jgi:hypothetical protein
MKDALSSADRLKALPSVAGAMLAGVALANGVALLAIAQGAESRPTTIVMRIAFIAGAVALLVLAPVFEALIRGRAIPPAHPRSPAEVYAIAKIAGFALREAVGLTGAVLGLFTGEPLWPALFGTLAIATLLQAWPRAEERERLARGEPS